MKRFYSIILSLSLAVCLSSCAYVQKGTGYLSDGGHYVGRQAGNTGRYVGRLFASDRSEVEDIVVSTQDFSNFEDRDLGTPLDAYARSVSTQSGGAVEVFSLDGASGAVTSNDALEPMRISSELPVIQPAVSRRVSGSSSVEVFALPGAVAPSSAPVSGVISPLERLDGFASPFDHQREVAPIVAEQGGEFVSLRYGDGAPVIIYFEHDSVFLNSRSKSQIEGVARSAQGGFGSEILVEGHASARGNFADDTQRHVVNLKISMDRAFAVARELMKNGVPAERIRTKSFGDTSPPRALNGLSREAASRRVEILNGR